VVAFTIIVPSPREWNGFIASEQFKKIQDVGERQTQEF
jgi:hypothetical protein